MGDKGWIALHRKLADDPLWLGTKFTPGQAWVDILLRANHTDAELIIGLKTINIKRGQFITSKVKLAERWGWDRKTVTTLLKKLKFSQMVDVKTDRSIQHGYTIITIQNYDKYQFDGQQKLQQEEQQSLTKTDTNNNENNGNNEITVTKNGFLSKLPILINDTSYKNYIVEDILKVTKDPHSRKLYELVATHIPEDRVRQILSEIKADGADNPAKLFTWKIKILAEKLSLLQKGEIA